MRLSLPFRPVILPLVLAAALSGCVATGPMPGDAASGPPPATPVLTMSGARLSAGAPILAVAARVEPVAEAMCRQRAAGRSCDFRVMVDDDRSQPANAFQTLDTTGRPVIVFTQALLDMSRNADELAFVLGHEAAHHVAGHIPRRQGQANMGAVLAGVLGQVSGMSGADLARVQEIGAGLAAQRYSKEFELEADSLGAEIAMAAGYDALRGAAFFARLPDPGEQMMGSHPSNAQRQAAVAATVRRLGGR